MGKLRTDSTDDFPVESRSGGIGYILIYEDNIEKKKPERDEDGNIIWEDEESLEMKKETYTESWEHFKSTKTEKSNLRDRLNEIDDYENVTLLGIWTGNHRTDTHVLELPRFLDRMKNADL